MSIIKRFRQHIARRYLHALQKEMVKHYPQLAFFNFDYVGRRIISEGFYEINYLESLAREVFPALKSKHICLDIGANIGNHSVFFADYFQRIYAYEPNLRPSKLLEVNALLKNNIKIFPFGLSNTTKKQKVFFTLTAIGSASVVHNRGGTEEAIFQLKCLDKVLTRGEINKISFMKIDAEGSEFNILKGAVNTIKTSKPVIVLEVLASDIENGTFAPKEFLEKLGYKFFYILQPKPLLKFIPCGRNSQRARVLIEAPKTLNPKGYKMLICAPYDLKA